ncbi:chymotrypsin [Rhodovulum sp. PH10]|uniref:S1C family serine protease n=1 Tax=Rhodovulum sp. PH10 TaxID=1187851 RepID=UPI00027C209A|nr:trypsin-like peptidase domain-containing protein [Rhodovulum sp. PH10]EJW10340.1 chymotrypsin [Rhodovulum sp. PH10]
MQKPLRLVLLVVAVALGVTLAQPVLQRWFYSATEPRAVEPRGDLAAFERTTIAIFDRVSPSVVQVAARTGTDAFAGAEGDEQGAQTGTGFIWDGAGHVVTNNHVVQGSTEIAVRLANGDVRRATVTGVAPNYDLAVLQLAGGGVLPPAIPIGTSGDLKVGQAAFAIGNPFGLDQSLTTGVISALKRRLPTTTGREIANVIQTDAAINPGNSGGPLLDSAGRLIGVNTAIFSPSGSNAGIGFAVPVDIVNRVVPALIAKGRVPTPGIGIVAAPEALATRLGVEGLVVVRTVPGSPADRAGLEGVDRLRGTLGDVIVAADGHPIRRLVDLTDRLEEVGVGQTISLEVLRGNRTVTVAVEVADIGRRP